MALPSRLHTYQPPPSPHTHTHTQVWMVVQQKWMYLEGIFIGGDIRQQLPEEAKKFDNIDKTFKKVKITICANPRHQQTYTEQLLHNEPTHIKMLVQNFSALPLASAWHLNLTDPYIDCLHIDSMFCGQQNLFQCITNLGPQLTLLLCYSPWLSNCVDPLDSAASNWYSIPPSSHLLQHSDHGRNIQELPGV